MQSCRAEFEDSTRDPRSGMALVTKREKIIIAWTAEVSYFIS
jgi:hypothetical protein